MNQLEGFATTLQLAQALHRRAKRLPRGLVVPPRILGELRQALVHREDVPLARALEPLQLRPLERHRDAEARPRARREGAPGGRTAAIAQVVHEDAAHAVLR